MGSTRELMKKMDALANIEDSIKRRIAAIKSPEEELEVNSLIKRAFSLECEFDRKHRLMLLALAIVPHEVSWRFKLRERFHRLIHHH